MGLVMWLMLRKCFCPVKHGFIIINIIPCVKLILCKHHSPKSTSTTNWSAFLRCWFMPAGIMVTSPGCCDLYSTSSTPCLNWLLCCVIMQEHETSKHAQFSFGEADMGGVGMGKNATTCYTKLHGKYNRRNNSKPAWICWSDTWNCHILSMWCYL